MTKKLNVLGFTLIELLVAATIMIVLTSIGVVSYQQVNQRSRNSKRVADMAQVRSALEIYRSDNGTYPPCASNCWATTLGTTLNPYIKTWPNDPKSVSPYLYSYTSAAGTSYTIQYYVEPNPGTLNTLSNP